MYPRTPIFGKEELPRVDTTLMCGEVAVFASWGGDLTGSVVSACSDIGVQVGNVHSQGFVPDTRGESGTSQATFHQIPPIEALGQSYLVTPAFGVENGMFIQLIAAFDGTMVRLGDQERGPLSRGDTLVCTDPDPMLIESNKPILALQYLPLVDCPDFPGCGYDVCLMPAVDNLQMTDLAFQTLDLPLLWNYPQNQFVNVIMKTDDVASGISLNGVDIGDRFQPAGPSTGYSFAAFDIAVGANRLESSHPFAAFAYGYMVNLGYMYNLTDEFTPRPIFENVKLGVDAEDQICPGDFADFTLSGDDHWLQHTTVEWQFGDGATAEGLSARHAWETPGTYEVLALLDLGSGCFNDTVKTTIDVTMPAFVARPDTVDFGRLAGCENSREVTFTLFNTGNADGLVERLTPQNSAVALVEPALPFNVPAGDSVEVTLRFTPETAGDVLTFLSLRAEPCRVLQAIYVKAAAEAMDVSVTPASLDFGVLKECDAPLTRTVTISNRGSAPFDVNNVTVSAPFVLSAMPRSPLPPNEQTTIEIELDPAQPGALYNEDLTFATDDGVCRRDWTVSCTAEVLTLDLLLPDIVDVGVFRGCEGRDTTLTIGLHNRMSVTLELEFSGVRAPFQISPEQLSLAPDAEAELLLVFAPQTSGEFNADMTITSDFCGRTFNVPLRAVYSPVQIGGLRDLNFGAVNLGEGRTQTLTLRNQGEEPLNIDRLTLAPAGGDYVVQQSTPPLPAVLAPDESIEIVVELKPHVSGEVNAQLNIESDAPCENIWTVSLNGEGRSAARTLVSLPDATAGIGEKIGIDLTLEEARDAEFSMPDGWRASIRYNRAVFDLRAVENATWSLRPAAADDLRIVDIEASFSGALNAGARLTTLEGVALMSLDTVTALEIIDFEWTGATLQNDTRDGSLILRDACLTYGLAIGGRPGFIIAPNPAGATLDMRVFNLGGIIPTIAIIDALGRTRRSEVIPNDGHLNTITLDIADLPAGPYYLRFGAAGYAESQMFVKTP